MATEKQKNLERLQAQYAKDPDSQIFAALAESYRDAGQLQIAAKIAKDGVQKHQKFASGLVIYGKILKDLNLPEEAVLYLKRATELAPESISAHQLLGEIYLQQKKPKDALKSFKMVLLLNPSSATARRAVVKLESLTADEYEDDLFSLEKLEPLNDWRKQFVNESSKPSAEAEQIAKLDLQPSHAEPAPDANRAVERMLSLIDAFIVRNDLPRAYSLLTESQVEFGSHPEILKRLKMVSGQPLETETATPLKPMKPRAELLKERKQELLTGLLQKVEAYRDQHLQV